MIQPGTKVTITIEATVMQARDGGPVFAAYGNGNEHMLELRADAPGVVITPAAR
jgi:hypothetical protein